ncbi:MAG: LiaF domain-containing protein, partial [Actinomycetota bacterium]
PSVLGRLVVGAAALAIGLGLLLDNLNVLKMTPRGTFAVLLAIVGLGLLIGTWFGSARWLIIPGILLVLALAITTFIPLHVRGGLGEVTWSPESRSELRGNYELFAGKAVLDLSKVNFGSHDRSVEVDVTFGELLVVVPDDQPVEINSTVQGGEMILFGQSNEGWDIEDRVQRSGDEDLGTLEVDAEVVFGKITVRRVRSTDDFETGRNNDRTFRFGDVNSGDAESFDFRPLELDRGGVR